jgi:hypothetical protein
MPATMPITTGSYLLGVIAGAVGYSAVVFFDMVGRGDPKIGLLLIALPAIIPVVSLIGIASGLLPFVLLRNVAPAQGIGRFAFVVAILAPIVAFVSLAGLLWIDGFTNYSPYSYSTKPPLADRIGKTLTEHWSTVLVLASIGGVACWGFDRRSLLFSEDPHVRRRARFLLAGSLAAFIVPVTLILTGNQFVVAYRAQTIAGDRPYCILVPNANGGMPPYETATRISQLSFINMQANYELTSGSRGGFYATNHALLIIDRSQEHGKPREYLNWSYRAENFVPEPLQLALQPDSCIPQSNFVTTLK